MDLALNDVQEELVASFAQLLAKESSPEHVRAAEPGGFDASLWRTLVDTGTVPMAVPEDQGGWGASLEDLALVAEQVGRAAAAAPVIETQVAARLLARAGAPASEALAAALAGEQIVTVALHPTVEGVARLVPAGAVANAIVVRDGDRLVLASVTDADRTTVDNLGSAPLADVRIGGDLIELASGSDVDDLWQVAVDEWLTLTAAAVIGLSAAAHDIACAYAAERRAFGQPIGAFQAIAHPLADDATNLDGARLLMWKAAWALDTGNARARELAAMAFAFAARSGEVATYNAIHTHGGYGFMLEYDVQLHYRRVRGWSRVWGDAEKAERRAADARYGSTGEAR